MDPTFTDSDIMVKGGNQALAYFWNSTGDSDVQPGLKITSLNQDK